MEEMPSVIFEDSWRSGTAGRLELGKCVVEKLTLTFYKLVGLILQPPLSSCFVSFLTFSFSFITV